MGLHFLSYSWNKTSSIVYPEVLVSTLNFPSFFRKVSMSWLVILSFSSLNAFWYLLSYFYSFFLLSLLRGFAMWHKFLIKHWYKFTNPKKIFTSFILVGVFHSLTSLTLLFSIWTSSLSTTTLSMDISLTSKLYFNHLKQRLYFSAIFKNCIVLSSSFFLVLVDITKSSI